MLWTPVHTVERLYRDARGGADVDDRACATLDEGRGGSVGEARESADVESNHVFHLLDVGVEQRRDGSAAGIVDEHGDARIVLQLCFHPREILLVVDVRYDRSGAASGRAGERCGERLERRLAARYQDEIVSPLCETICVDCADAARGAGDEGGAL